MKNNFLTKRRFTLVEIFIVSVLVVGVVGAIIALMVQVYAINRESMVDTVMTRGSRLIRRQLDKTYQISQAMDADIDTVGDFEMDYEVVEIDAEWPTAADVEFKSYELSFEDGKILAYDKDTLQSKELNKMGVKIVDMQATVTNADGEECIPKVLQINYLLESEINGKIYQREEIYRTVLDHE